MSASDILPTPDGNRLLRSLAEEAKSHLIPKLQPFVVAAGDTFYEPGDAITAVYFPTTAVIAVMNIMEDGESVAVAIVGYEGVVGVELLSGHQIALAGVMALLPGHAFKLAAEVFMEDTGRGVEFRSTLPASAQTLMAQIFQSAGCNRLHSVEERCARWLLMMHDRTRSDEFPLTQEMLSQMLGVRRQSVGVVADSLQKAGLIRYSRGKIRIRSRHGLEGAACECYRRVKEEFDRLMSM